MHLKTLGIRKHSPIHLNNGGKKLLGGQNACPMTLTGHVIGRRPIMEHSLQCYAGNISKDTTGNVHFLKWKNLNCSHGIKYCNYCNVLHRVVSAFHDKISLSFQPYDTNIFRYLF